MLSFFAQVKLCITLNQHGELFVRSTWKGGPKLSLDYKSLNPLDCNADKWSSLFFLFYALGIYKNLVEGHVTTFTKDACFRHERAVRWKQGQVITVRPFTNRSADLYLYFNKPLDLRKHCFYCGRRHSFLSSCGFHRQHPTVRFDTFGRLILTSMVFLFKPSTTEIIANF